MSMLDGISQCWWLSETCKVDWTAWAAIATFFAAAVALFVGLAPMREARAARSRLAIAALKLLLAEATDQAFFLRIAIAYFSRADANSRGYSEALQQFAKRIDAQPFKDFVLYLDAVPEDVSEGVTACAVVIGSNLQLLNRKEAESGPGPFVPSMIKSLTNVVESLDKFRKAGGAVIGQPPIDNLEHVAVICEGIARASLNRKSRII